MQLYGRFISQQSHILASFLPHLLQKFPFLTTSPQCGQVVISLPIAITSLPPAPRRLFLSPSHHASVL
nr:MAG TPA: hypothetical protein [Caudoviricetes sp.]